MPEKINPAWYTKPNYVTTFEEALEDVAVHGPGMWENALSEFEGDDASIKDWYAVSTGNNGIVAYFVEESDALSFRLRLIDRWFNG